MIAAGEKLFGPYRWSRYDILVLPPSFPVGGMENPRLSFITPTVIVGDKSLVSLIAHELAHVRLLGEGRIMCGGSHHAGLLTGLGWEFTSYHLLHNTLLAASTLVLALFFVAWHIAATSLNY